MRLACTKNSKWWNNTLMERVVVSICVLSAILLSTSIKHFPQIIIINVTTY